MDAYADLLLEENTICSLKSTAEVVQANMVILCVGLLLPQIYIITSSFLTFI